MHERIARSVVNYNDGQSDNFDDYLTKKGYESHSPF